MWYLKKIWLDQEPGIEGDAFVYAPTETPDFITRFGEDNPLRSHKFYASQDRNLFSRIKWVMVFQCRYRGAGGQRSGDRKGHR